MRRIDELRPLTAGRLMGLWRAAREAAEDPLERTLLCNAGVLAYLEALRRFWRS